MQDHAQNDVEARRIGAELFRQPGAADVRLQVYGQGKTRLLENVLHRYDQLDWHSAPLDPFLKTLRQCVAPDMDLDLVGAGLRNNEGLTHIHRRTDAMDIYFVSNLQYAPVNASAGFRVTSGQPYRWNPGTGERQPILSYARDEQYTRVRLSMEPFESRFIVFENTGETRELPHVVRSDFAGIVDANHEGFTALAGHNGPHAYQFFDGETIHSGSEAVKDLPAVYEVNGAWKVKFVGEGAPRDEFQWLSLRSWTDDDRLRHFSGTAHYAIVFDLPEEYCSPDTPLRLSLGVVGNIAEIRLNGKDVGVHWMNGQRFEVDGIAQPGRNTLIIEVTNTLINRVSGLDVFPEVPKDLQDYFGTGIARSNAEADKLRGFGPLPRSGLLGPVRITPFRQVRVAAPASNALSR
jgi:hypothetical protein